MSCHKKSVVALDPGRWERQVPATTLLPEVEHGCPPAPFYCRLTHPFAVGLEAIAADAVQNQDDWGIFREVAAPAVVLPGLPPVQSSNATVFALEELPPVAAFQHASSDRYPERDMAEPHGQLMTAINILINGMERAYASARVVFMDKNGRKGQADVSYRRR